MTEQALTKLQKVVDTWKNSYGPVIVKLTNEEFILDYLTYVDYPPEVRRMIYTTNSIENLNR
jgi:transposase-like protein